MLRVCVVLGLSMFTVVAVAQRPRTSQKTDSALSQTENFLVRHRGSAVSQTSSDAVARQQQVRSTLLSLMGGLPEPTPLHSVTLGTTSLPGIRIEKVLFDSQPNFHVTALLYLPDVTLVKPFPAIVLPSSDGGQGKAADFALATAFARNGFAVLSYDRIGQGERRQYDNIHVSDDQDEASLQPILMGESIARYLVWDAMRAVDYLQSRGEIDPAHIGAFGCSGAGADVALLAALDIRIAATGTACYLTSFPALLKANIAPQDAEQSLPGLLSHRLDYADYVEAAAPRPYAIIATQKDYLPFSGTRDTEIEARRFYSVFDSLLPTINNSILDDAVVRDPTHAFAISAAQNLAFINAPGGHGQLKPMLPRILKFFSDCLQSAAIAPVYDEQSSVERPPPGAFQVTPTGQVSSFDLNSATVFSLNLAHAQTLPPSHPDNLPYLQGAVNQSAGTKFEELKAIPREQIAVPGTGAAPPEDGFLSRADVPVRSFEQAARAGYRIWHIVSSSGEVTSRLPVAFEGDLYVPQSIPQRGAEPSLTLLLNGDETVPFVADAQLETMMRKGQIILVLTPQPTLAQTVSRSEMGRTITMPGPWFQPSLRYMLVGTTILGRRMGDILYAIDYLSLLKTPHKAGIEVYADGHLALAMVHAAVFDSRKSPRIAQLHLSNLPTSYAQMLAAPLPGDISQDILPGVLLRYDVPDLLAAIYGR